MRLDPKICNKFSWNTCVFSSATHMLVLSDMKYIQLSLKKKKEKKSSLHLLHFSWDTIYAILQKNAALWFNSLEILWQVL